MESRALRLQALRSGSEPREYISAPLLLSAERLERLASAPVDVRAEAIALLDEISRPMTVREIERSLKAAGLSRSASVALSSALKGIDIIALRPLAEEPCQ